MNKYIVIIYFLIIINIFINSKPLPNIKNKIYREKAHNKEYYNRLVKRGLELDKIEIGKPYPSIKKIDYKKDKIIRKEYEESFKNKKNRRRLSSNLQTLEELGFVDLYQNNSYSDELYALKFIINSVKKEESKFILYPYPFNYKDKNNEIKKVENGGFFTLNETLLESGKFNYLQNISSVQIGKAKGIYDIDIAILSEIFTYYDNDIDLFTESGHYCDYFVTQLYKLTSCLRGKEEYLKYKLNYPNKGAVAEISINDLLNNTLYDEEDQLKFKLLIISDYLIRNEETIIDRFNENCVNILKKYRELGGHIIVSGKSGYLLELLGIFPSGTYNTSITFHSKYRDYTNKIYGCENIYKNSPDEQQDFFKQLICMGFKNRTYLSQGYIMNKIPENFESYINYTNEEKTIYYKTNDGHILQTDNDVNIKYHYLLASKEEKTQKGKLKGRIMLINGNPIKDMYYFGNVRNMILYAMSKNLIYDLKIKFNNFNSDEELPIPAGEEGVQLLTSYKLYNLGDYDISNIDIDILIANNVELKSNADNCKIENDNKYKDLNMSYLNKTKYLKCHLDNLEQLKSYSDSFNIEIKHFSVTQKMYDIPLIYSNIKYIDNELQREVISSPGIFFAQAQVAALLRGTINKDPTSIYPIEGYGRYFDLVLDIENKEGTEAKEVNFISLIPLVTPLFDGEDEGSVSKVIPLYEEYYENHKYSYPWSNVYNKDEDYIDYVEVAGKNVCYVADYDTPVKIAKKNRYELNDTVENLFVPKGKMKPDEYAGFDSTNANSLLKQIYFADNEKFYETAKARTSLFINSATEEGAKALYGDNIPEDLKDPYNDKRTKVQYAFIRVDTYFYNSIHDQYQLPNGFDNSILISIDEFDQSSLGEPKGEVLGDRKPTIVNKGHYNSNEEKYNRLKPNEYSNSLREYKFMKQYNPTKPEELKELQKLTNSTVKLSHFMVPFTDKIGITHAGSIYGFKENEGGKDGYLEQYPSVRFIYGHSIDLILDPAKTRLGGKVEFTLDDNIKFKNEEDPIANEKITVSADNVAFYKTEYKDNKIILYFKRGLMPNENYGQPSKCKVFLEDINLADDFDITIKLYNFKYDFSKETLESFIPEEETKALKAEYKPFFSLPCLYMENKLSRKNLATNETSDKMYEYEVMNPYARYGGYYQELTKHTSVYASAEAHHVKRPGFQSASSGFSLLANIGTSSVPFAEFLQHGKLAVPGVVSTSRIEWIDIWGRKWAQNLRSVYPDIPVLPPVPLSFIMTTTYELISDDEKQERLLEWPSDESAYIRIQMKIRNTYKLYWEPTFCKNNQISFFKERYDDYRNPIFVDFDNENAISGDDNDINLGFTSQYGMCYDTNSYIGGKKITNEILNGIKEMKICSDSEDAVKMSECSKKADELGLPLLKKRPDNINDENDETPNKNWNYSPLIESYYPKGYIHSNQMWQLTMEEDYSDDSFYKGYPYHLDDCIPNLDNPITKPHDLIAFPIFKGLGYNISYSNEYSLNKFKDYKGWWSDQLQNKDHTLLAGQENVNQISVDKESLLKDSDWINASKLKNSIDQNLINKRLKNIYVCQYNQNRVKITPNQNKYSFLKNVYQNNVVPVLPDLSENDERYTNFDCSNENSYQYTPYNISKVDNRVYTGNDRDWLYFAVGLRSNAKENINVILKLEPIEGTKFEGVTKIQDGGRFTYWQPPDGPNSYQYYDSNVNTIISKRIDLSIVHRIIPNSVYAFNSQVYQLFTIEDRKENNREYTMNSYMNSHGYGDATTTVYVGGTDSTSCKVNPGNFTYVKITFYNNAGFDWKMKEDAITMNPEGYSLALNAASIMLGKVTAIQYPKKYNFMDYIIPDEIKPYVTMTPSQHNLDISPQFYDLTFNNVLNIKDALEGDYFYCLNVSKSFPEKYKGKLWEIKMKLNEECFESLPSVNDPTNIHDYHLTIPSIKFGVPISKGSYAGKVFYNLGQASNITINYKLIKELMFKNEDKIRIVNEKDIHDLTVAISNNDNKYDKLEEIWNSLKNKYPEVQKKIKFSYSKNIYDSYQNVTIDLSNALPLFPYESEQNPFVTNFSILVHSYSVKIPFGYFDILKDTQITYNDGRKTKTVYADDPLNINCFSSGPKIQVSIEDETYSKDLLNTQFFSQDKTIYKGDETSSLVKVFFENHGTDTSYYNSFDLHLNRNADLSYSQSEFFELKDLGINNGCRDVHITYKGRLDAGDYIAFEINLDYPVGNREEVKYPQFGDRRILEGTKEEKELTILYGLDISFCLDNYKCNEGDKIYVKDKIDLNYSISYINEQRTVGRMFLKGENIGTDIMPKYVLTATIGEFNPIYNVSTVKYSFKRKIEGEDKDYVEIAFTDNNTIIDEPFKEGEIDEKKQYKVSYIVIGFFTSGRTFDSLSQNRITYSYGIEDEEVKKDNLSIYLIVICILVGMAAILLGGFLIYKFGCKKKHYIIEESDGGSSHVSHKRKFEKVNLKDKSTSRSINNNIKVINFVDNK